MHELALYIVIGIAWILIISQAPQVMGDTVQWGKDVWDHYTKEKSSADGTAEQDKEW